MRLRFLVRPLLLACLALVAATACSHRTAPDTVPHPTAGLDPPSAPEWERDMARFAAEDAATPPPAKAYVFTGSSSVRMWDSLAADFPGKPVLNRGFVILRDAEGRPIQRRAAVPARASRTVRMGRSEPGRK